MILMRVSVLSDLREYESTHFWLGGVDIQGMASVRSERKERVLGALSNEGYDLEEVKKVCQKIRRISKNV